MFAIASPLAISGIPTSSGNSVGDDMGVDGMGFCGEPRNGCGRDGSVKTIAAMVRKQEMIEGKGKPVYRMSSLLFNRDFVVANQTPTAPDVSGRGDYLHTSFAFRDHPLGRLYGRVLFQGEHKERGYLQIGRVKETMAIFPHCPSVSLLLPTRILDSSPAT
jgi:hypothetical protein